MLASLPRRSPTAVLVTLAIASLTACGSESPTSSAPIGSDQSNPSPTASSPELRKLEQQANQLLDGGPEAFKARLAELRGTPAVVNQWASWCGPCRHEFPFFQRLADKYAGRVAFLGVNSQDNREDAAEFLEELPVPFPHYYDTDALVARVFRGGRAWPTTAFYAADGRLAFTRAGAYASEAKLDEDIRKYALGRG